MTTITRRVEKLEAVSRAIGAPIIWEDLGGGLYRDPATGRVFTEAEIDDLAQTAIAAIPPVDPEEEGYGPTVAE